MEKKIKIPNSVNDMKIDQLPFYLELLEITGDKIKEDFITSLDPVQVSDLNALFFRAEEGAFDIYDDASNRKVLSEILISSKKYDKGPLIDKIEVDGVDYVLSLDFTKQPVSFHRDISKIDLKTNSEAILGLLYIEKGKVYNEIDPRTKIVLNPSKERVEKLKNHFSLAQFLDLQSFFLRNWQELKPFLNKRRREKAKS